MKVEIHNERVKKLQKLIGKQNIDVCVLFDRENFIYFTGIEQVECMTVIIPRSGKPVGIVLWLDLEFIKNNCFLEDIRPYVFPRESITDMIIKIIKEMGYSDPVIGFEKSFISINIFNSFKNEFNVNKFVSVSEIIYKLRSIKTFGEIKLIEKAAKSVCTGMKAAVKIIKSGVKELDVAAEAEYASMKAGSEGSPFRPQIVSGIRTLITHPFATEKRIENGELVLIHIGAKCGGYTAKMCRTVAIGNITKEQKDIFEVIKKTQTEAIKKLRPGIPVNEVYIAARKVVEKAGYIKYFLDVIGYGVGLRQSEFYPIIALNNNVLIEENMVVDVLLPTIYKRGSGGSRITDTIFIEKSKPKI